MDLKILQLLLILLLLHDGFVYSSSKKKQEIREEQDEDKEEHFEAKHYDSLAILPHLNDHFESNKTNQIKSDLKN